MARTFHNADWNTIYNATERTAEKNPLVDWHLTIVTMKFMDPSLRQSHQVINASV
jgi:hypothetical protein